MDDTNGCWGCIVLIVGILLFSSLYKRCTGVLVQLLVPDNGEYVLTDDDYYHRSVYCGAVNVKNFAEDIDYNTVKEEGFNPCPFCKPN